MLYNTKKYSSYRTKCQFSKKIIEKGTIISLFTIHDYNKFVEHINNLLFKFFPDEIIDYIIHKTGYERYINYWGISEYTEFRPSIHILNNLLPNNKYSNDDDTNDDTNDETNDDTNDETNETYTNNDTNDETNETYTNE